MRAKAVGLKAGATAMLLSAIMPQYLLPGLIVEIRHDFVLSDAQLGFATGVSFAMAAIASTTVGSRLARDDPRVGLALAASLIATCCLGIGAIADSWNMVAGFMAVGGFGAGVASPSLYGLVATGTRGEGQGMALGILSAAPQMSAFVAGLTLPLIALPLDWRLAYILPAVTAVTSAALLWRISGPAVRRGAESPGSTQARHRSRVLIRAAFSSSLVSAGGLGLRAFLILAAIDAGMGPSAAAALFSVTAVVTILSRITLGSHADRSSRDPWGQASLLMLVGAAGMLIMVIGTPLAVIIGALVAGGLGWAWQPPLNVALARSHPEAAGPAIASAITGFYIGGLIGPLLVGVVVHSSGFSAAWVLCAALSVAGAASLRFAARATRASD